MSLLNGVTQVPQMGDVVAKINTVDSGDGYGHTVLTFASGKVIWFSLTTREPVEACSLGQCDEYDGGM